METVYIVIFIAVVILVALGIAHHYLSTHRPLIVFITSTLGGMAALIGVYLTIFQLGQLTEQHELSIQQKREEKAFSYMEKWDPEIQVRVEKILSEFVNKSLVDKLNILIIDESHNEGNYYQKPLAKTLSLFEELGLAVRRNYADEQILCFFYEENIIRYWGQLQDIVHYNRTNYNKPLLFENFEWLYDRWKRGCPKTPEAI